MEAVSSQEQENLESFGWYSHFVVPVGDGAEWVNYHTHGLPELYGHPDFQFVLPIDGNTLHGLATKLVERVKKGERFTAGAHISGIIRNHDVLLIGTAETASIRRRVLRVVLPDKVGNLDKGSVSGIFAAQFRELPG